MKQSLTLATLALALGATALAPSALAAAPTLMGSYAVDMAKSDSVPDAIEKALSQVNPIIKLVARGRLTSTNVVNATITLSASGGNLTVVRAGAPVMTGPSNGSSFRWAREDGEMLDVSLKLTGNHLVQTFKAKEGQRTNTYDLNPDGKGMKVAVRVTSDKLPTPLTYTLAYKRQ